MARRTRFLRFILRASAVTALLALIALTAGYAWLGSHHALNWAVRQAVEGSDGRLALEGVEGSLLREVRARRVAFDADDFDLEAETLALRWQPFSLLLGELRVSSVTATRLRYTQTGDAAPSTPPSDLALPLRVIVPEARVGRLELDADQVIEDLQLRYRGGRRAHRVALLGLRAKGWHLAGELRVGAKPPFTMNGKLQAQGMLQAEPLEASATISGSLEALKVEAGANTRGASISADALLRPYADMPVATLKLHAEGVDLAAWDKALPRTRMTLEGNAQTNVDGELTGNAHAVNAEPGLLDAGRLPLAEARAAFGGKARRWTFPELDMRLAGTGRITGSGALQDGTVRLDLAFKEIEPSRIHGSAQSASVSGRAALSGDDAAQRLEAQLEGAGLQLQVAARHADHVLTVDAAQLHAGDGRLDFSGRFALDAARAFAIEGKFAQLDPSRFLQSPPARLNGTVSAKGALAPTWQAQVQLAIANSELRGLPLTVNARFATNAERLFDGEARAAIGRNRANVEGRYGQPDDSLRWTIDAADLRALDPALAGSVKGRGSFAGTVETPAIEFNLSAQRIAVREFRATSVETQGAVAAGGDGALRLSAKASGLHTPYARIDALQLESSGTRRRHTLQATLRGHDTQATLSATGGLDNERRWTGTLDRLEARGPWPLRLTAPANLAIGPDLFVIEQLQAAVLDGELGPAGVRVEDGRIATHGAFRGVAVGGLLARNPAFKASDLRLGGRWNLALADTFSGTAEMQREQGDVTFGINETLTMALRRLALSLTATDNAIDIAFDADSESMGSASARVSTRITQRDGQWLLSRDAPLSGNATLDMRSLAWAHVLAPELDRIDGRLAAKATLGGTIAAPDLSGTINGDALAVRALIPGLDWRDGRLRAAFDGKILKINEFYISAGKGKIEAEGSIDIAGGLRGLDITARAERAQILASPQFTVVTSGKARAGLRDNRLALEGNFRVDEGRYDLG
ncbi:MAG: hypothetical protein KIT18_07500, partial [Burkholderiales bacterium]|nr:hypothetical protein [Burkholderiales bacterium]